MMSTNFIAEFQPQGPGNSFHSFSAEILLQPLRISEIEKVEAMKALREKRRDSCLGSHFLREQYNSSDEQRARRHFRREQKILTLNLAGREGERRC